MLVSFIQGRFNRKSATPLNDLVMKAKEGEEEVMNDLLFEHASFMKKTASFVCKRFIDEHDDEFSVAMNGFHEAVMKFDPTKQASLPTFAHLIIRRRLIDHMRRESSNNQLLIYELDSTAEGEDTPRDELFDEPSIEVYSKDRKVAQRREEIVQYQKILQEYDLSFEELGRSSPKHREARQTAIQIAQIIVETPEFHEFLTNKQRLPLKELEKLVEVSRKTIERHRKYIISIVLLLNSDLFYLKEYIKGELQ